MVYDFLEVKVNGMTIFKSAIKKLANNKARIPLGSLKLLQARISLTRSIREGLWTGLVHFLSLEQTYGADYGVLDQKYGTASVFMTCFNGTVYFSS